MTDEGRDRSSAEQLAAIASGLSQQRPSGPSSRRWLPILIGVLGVGALVGGVIGLLGTERKSTGSSNTAVGVTTTEPDATAPTAPASSSPAATTPAATTPAATTPAATTPALTTAPVTTAPVTTAGTATTIATTSTSEALIVDPSNPVRWAEFTGGKVYLEGRVPDQATADELRDKAAGVVGPDNVVVQYIIDPAAPRPNSAPLFVRDSVLFPPGSIEINDVARGVLDLGVALMTQNPQVTIDINGYTDADGSEEANLALSQARVDAIFGYLVSQGIDPAKLSKTAHGEADPVADNATADGRAKNRRVEFTVNNLLG